MKSLIANALNAIGVNTNSKLQPVNRTLLLAAGCIALLPLASQAQRPLGTSVVMHAEIPFQFTAGNRIMPAGKYRIHFDRSEHVVVLENVKDYARVSVGAATPYRKAADAGKGRLEFNEYGSAAVLKKVWMNGENQGAMFPETKRERELAAKANSPVHTASVVSE